MIAMNGYAEFFLFLPVFIMFMLGVALVVAYATEKEMERWVKKFRAEHGRDPRPDEWPDPPSMYP